MVIIIPALRKLVLLIYRDCLFKLWKLGFSITVTVESATERIPLGAKPARRTQALVTCQRQKWHETDTIGASALRGSASPRTPGVCSGLRRHGYRLHPKSHRRRRARDNPMVTIKLPALRLRGLARVVSRYRPMEAFVPRLTTDFGWSRASGSPRATASDAPHTLHFACNPEVDEGVSEGLYAE